MRNGDFFSDPSMLKPAQKSIAAYDTTLCSQTADTKGNPQPRFLTASLNERLLWQFYFISYVSYISCPDKWMLQSPKALQVIKLPLIT